MGDGVENCWDVGGGGITLVAQAEDRDCSYASQTTLQP